MLTDIQRKRVFGIIIINQCLGMLSASFFQNGLFLNYFTKLGVSSAALPFLFSIPALLSGFLMLPLAFLADRKGKLRLALIGQVLVVLSMLMIMAAGWGATRLVLPLLVGAMLVFAVGGSLQGASWFALLSPIVPKEIRGRFFGWLRVIFQTVTIVFSLLITRALDLSDSMATFQVVLGVVFVAHIARYFTYARIPELEKEHVNSDALQPFKAALISVFKVPGFGFFNGYLLLITLFTAGVPVVFGLMQKDVFGFTPAQITLMGTFFLVGSVWGNLIGGRLVDRCGTRVVFLMAQVFSASIILGMIARHWMPWPLVVHVGLCACLFSLVESVKGIAMTSEIMGLIPSANRSLSTAVCMSLFSLGIAGSNLFVSRSICGDVLPSEWQMFGCTFTAYDSILLGFAVLVLLLLIAIGLVPRIVKKSQLMPGSGYPRI